MKVADRRTNELVVEWHLVDADQMKVLVVSDDGPSADRQVYSCIKSAEGHAA
jgi:hypothetical protein